MALTVLITITTACIAWSLWIRRVTWSCRWEVAATLNIALQGMAVLLMSPLASETLGHWLHAATGKWNLEDYIGHDLYVVAASAVVYNALGRLQDDHAMQKTFKQYVELPATLCIPLLLATFTLGNGANVPGPPPVGRGCSACSFGDLGFRRREGPPSPGGAGVSARAAARLRRGRRPSPQLAAPAPDRSAAS